MSHPGQKSTAGRLLRLAVITSGTYPFQAHGAEIGVFYLSRGLAMRGYGVTLYLSEFVPKGTPVEQVELPQGMTMVHPLGIAIPILYNLSFIATFILKVKRTGQTPRVIAVNIPTLLSLATAYFARWILHIPYLAIVHGPPDLRIEFKPAKSLQRFFIRRATLVVCVSRDLAHLVEETCSIEPRGIRVIPNGYSEPEIQQATPLSFDNMIHPELIFVGGLDKNKDPITLIRAFKIVSEAVPDALLHIVGTGPLEEAVRNLVAEEQLRDKVILHGSMPHAELLKLIGRCSVLVLTSHEEGMPTIVIEALAMGRPVVASEVGGIPEIVMNGANGFLVPVADAGGLAGRVLQILRNSDLKARLSQNAKQSSKDLEWSHIAGLYASLIEAIVQ